MSDRKPIPSRTRFAVFQRDHFRCHYCGATGGMAQLHADHIVPRAAGGSDDTTNLITACERCNLGKSDTELGRDLMPTPRPAKVRRSRRRAKRTQPPLDSWYIPPPPPAPAPSAPVGSDGLDLIQRVQRALNEHRKAGGQS